jgi:hypothetical protein
MRLIDADELKEILKDPPLYASLGGMTLNDVFMLIDNEAPSIDLIRCAECEWSRPRTLKGETGYRCLFYRVDKAENGYCDNGEREGE